MKHPLLPESAPEAAEPIDKFKAKPLVERIEEEKAPELREQLRVAAEIADLVKESGGRALVVGGFARDEALRLQGREIVSKDIDLEIYGIVEINELATIVAQFGDFDIRGEQFSVLSIKGVDIAPPRRESKTGPGHRGFLVDADPFMSFREASRRRDFTVNAIALNPSTGEFIDEWGGLSDLERGILRVVDPETFVDDPLRPLRAVQFAARFGFSISPETAALCRSVNLRELPRERVGEEWLKLVRAPQPSLGLRATLELGILEQLHPDLKKVAGDPDRWEHLCRAVDAAAVIAGERDLDDHRRGIFVLSALCLPLREEGAKRLLSQLNISKKTAREIFPLMRVYQLDQKTDDGAIRRLAVSLYPSNIEEFYWVLKADNGGEEAKISGEILAKARALGVEKRPPVPLISGTDVMDNGVPEGSEVGRILHAVYEAQLRGEVKDPDEARHLVRELWGRGK